MESQPLRPDAPLDALRERQAAQRPERPGPEPAPSIPRGIAPRDRTSRRDWLVAAGFCLGLLLLAGLLGVLLPVGETTRVALRGNLDANAPPGTTVHTFVEVFDSERQVHRLGLVFTRQRTPHTWELRGYLSARSGRMLDDQIVNIVFGVDGALVAIGDPEAAMTFQINGLSVPQTVRFHLGTPGQFDGLTQLPDPGLPPRQAPLLALRASDDGRTLAEQHPELASRLQLLLTASHFSSDQSAAGNPLASLACSGIIRSR